MPKYRQSKSQKRSKSQSKNGGRRRKRTLKNVRRRKSRKVMRGGATYQDIHDNMKGNWNDEFTFQFNKDFNQWVTSKKQNMDNEADLNDTDLNKFGPFKEIKGTLK